MRLITGLPYHSIRLSPFWNVVVSRPDFGFLAFCAREQDASLFNRCNCSEREGFTSPTASPIHHFRQIILVITSRRDATREELPTTEMQQLTVPKGQLRQPRSYFVESKLTSFATPMADSCVYDGVSYQSSPPTTPAHAAGAVTIGETYL